MSAKHQLPIKKLRTLTYAADYLGVSAATIYRLIKSGQLKTRKIGHSVRIHDNDLESFGVQKKDEPTGT